MDRTTRVNLLIGTGHFLSHFYVLCLPPMVVLWHQEFGVSYAHLGITVMLMSGVTAALQTPVGFLVDKHGARKFLVGGTLLMTLTIALMGVATAFWQILLLAALSGVGNSVIHPADYAILAGSVPKEKMGRSFAVHTFNGNLGFFLGPMVMGALTPLIGWRLALIAVGLVGIPLVATILAQSSILVDQVRVKRSADQEMSGAQLLLTKPMLLFFGFFFLSSVAGGGMQSWLITVLQQTKGLSAEIGATTLGVYMAGATAGVLVGGWAADRIKAHLTFATVLTIISAALLVVIAWTSLPVWLMSTLLFASGVAVGSSRTPRDMMVRDAAPPGQVGKVFGFISSGLPLGGAVAGVPLGYVLDQGHPEWVLPIIALILLLSLCCVSTARVVAGHRAEAGAVVPAE